VLQGRMADADNALPNPDQLLAMMPYAAALGIELHEATPSLTSGSLAWSPERCTAGGILHGGAIMSLADTIGAICAFLNLPKGAATATIDSTTRLYRPLRAGTLNGIARPAHVGRTLIVVATDLTDDQERLVAQTSQAQAVT
jgi:1,4-dihydroxy-2-naphthoyl-CoA hydrolase